ncbi:hypothetical protein L2E82_49341 [Cichorium intybus]|uniref:Uncharacterized protein n=1 Tax=Cichorium intybus TaxID=13427 RepID=A0ACB8Z0H7_CICIN|nr:hypothetical protein L2E82_49341 [Cichorium intybus]
MWNGVVGMRRFTAVTGAIWSEGTAERIDENVRDGDRGIDTTMISNSIIMKTLIRVEIIVIGIDAINNRALNQTQKRFIFFDMDLVFSPFAHIVVIMEKDTEDKARAVRQIEDE